MAFSIELISDEITKRLNKLADEAPGVLKDALEAAATIMAARGQRAFDEPGLRRKAWAPLSTRHYEKRAEKARKKTPKDKKAKVQLLIDSGALYQSVQSQGAIFGASAPYAAAHQFGYEDGGLPERPYLPITSDGESLTDEAEEEVIEVIQDAVEMLAE